MEEVKFTLKHPIWESGQEGGISRPINRDVLFRNLVELRDILNKHGLKWWLSHGTMLGAYRENNLIAHDDDADIGLDMTYRDRIYPAIEDAKKAGFFVPPQAIKDTIVLPTLCPYSDSVFIRDGEKIEGWWYDKKEIYNKNTKENEMFYIYDEFRSGWALKHPAKFYDELKTMTFRGEEFPIPNHIEEWLVHFYGEDWKIPNKKKKYNTHNND